MYTLCIFIYHCLTISLPLFLTHPYTPSLICLSLGEQPKALSHAIKAFAGNIEDVSVIEHHFDPVVHKHCALSVKPEHYPIVHDNMMFTIGQVLAGAVTPGIDLKYIYFM